jgi:MFS family permease
MDIPDDDAVPNLDKNPTGLHPQATRHWYNRTVIGAGLTSGLGDFCYETTTVILPGFLAVLGIPAAVLGVVEGLADAVASFTKIFAGYFADKLGHRKSLVVVGYGLTPLGQILIALSFGWPLLLAGRLISWFGKGLRGPLRDAIVIQSIEEKTRGRAFGFHRAMDTLGAVLGPLFGVALLGWSQGLAWDDPSGPFRLVLWASVIPGMLSVLAFLILVRDPEYTPNPALRFVTALRDLPSRFKRFLRAVGVFGLGDFSHSLLILAATQWLTPHYGIVRAAQIAGLCYVGRNLTQLITSYPIGALADRVGALPVLVVGYLLGGTTAVLASLTFFFNVESVPWIAGIFVIGGLYMAVQEALESTATAAFVTEATLGTGLGALGTVNGTAKFIASATVGVLWTAVSPVFGFGLAAAFMIVGAIMLTRLRRNPTG